MYFKNHEIIVRRHVLYFLDITAFSFCFELTLEQKIGLKLLENYDPELENRSETAQCLDPELKKDPVVSFHAVSDAPGSKRSFFGTWKTYYLGPRKIANKRKTYLSLGNH